MDKYSGLIGYLKYLNEELGLEICINDFTGFLLQDEELGMLLQPYLIHKNSYCMHIKSNRDLWDRCLGMKRNIFNKCKKNKAGFYGMCFCGIEEYIVPIFNDTSIIGVICVGEFSINSEVADYRIKKVSKAYGLDYTLAKSKFMESTRLNKLDPSVMNSLFNIVSEYISNILKTLTSKHGLFSGTQTKSRFGEAYVLYHAIEYIKQNFQERLTVIVIAEFCHCSESYINHLFKKNMKTNIKNYINKIRTEYAKIYLLNSNDSIQEIALKVGFDDPNYFSTVFKSILGISPTAYKKKLRVLDQNMLCD